MCEELFISIFPYCKVLKTLKRLLNKTRPDLKIIWLLHHDNVKPRIASLENFWKKEKLKFLHTLCIVLTLLHANFGFLEPENENCVIDTSSRMSN